MNGKRLLNALMTGVPLSATFARVEDELAFLARRLDQLRAGRTGRARGGRAREQRRSASAP